MIVLTDDWQWDDFGSIAQYVLVLLIASIPVALPAVMSVTLAIGAYTLSLQKAIVSRLSAIEELAGVDILCSDKTGTLTMNALSVQASIAFADAKPEDVLRAAARATQQSSQDAIDVAVLKDAGRARRDARDDADELRPVRPRQQAHRCDRHRCRRPRPPLCQGRPAGHRGASLAGPGPAATL